VTPLPISALSTSSANLCIGLTLVVPSAAAGLALINAGLGRSRSASHAMIAAIASVAVAAIVYFVCGFAWQGYLGQPAHILTIAGKPWNWIAAEPFFFRGLRLDGDPASLVAWLQMYSVGLAAVIPLGSGAERWRLSASCASTALLAAWTYPLFAHWVWGGGWLAQLGKFYGLGRGFVDAGGSGCIQAVGGLTALSIAWVLGPRRGKRAADGILTALPGHNAVYALFGCMLALMGWLGLNSAGAILFASASPGRVVLIVINTTLSASAAALTAAVVTRLRFGKPDASLSANGWLGGLVASSAACPFVGPATAVVIGFVAGAVVTSAVEWVELKLGVDDPSGAVSVHGVCGIWGLLAVGLFGRFPMPVANMVGGRLNHSLNAGSGQWLAQLVGIATLAGFVLPLTYGLNWVLDRFFHQRVAPEGERQGMDLSELGAGAYPEFVTHSEDFTQL
jgi:ammonium transporter, Amt family